MAWRPRGLTVAALVVACAGCRKGGEVAAAFGPSPDTCVALESLPPFKPRADGATLHPVQARVLCAMHEPSMLNALPGPTFRLFAYLPFRGRMAIRAADAGSGPRLFVSEVQLPDEDPYDPYELVSQATRPLTSEEWARVADLFEAAFREEPVPPSYGYDPIVWEIEAGSGNAYRRRDESGTPAFKALRDYMVHLTGRDLTKVGFR